MARVSPSLRHLPLVSLLAALTALPANAADLPGGLPPGDFAFEGQWGFDDQGVATVDRGFVARKGTWILTGDAARYDQRHDDLYAKGRVVLVMPGIRLHADRLGMRQKAESGDAWNVEVFLDQGDHRLVMRAERCHFDRRTLVLQGVSIDAGHGAVMCLRASSAKVYLRDQPAKNREGIAQRVEGVSLSHVRSELMGVPVLYLPYLYRDFIYNYPWTRYEVGASKRQGSYVHAWIGTAFPSVFDWTPGVDVRGDMHSGNGEAMGVRTYWSAPDRGAGEISWYRMPHEQLHDPNDDDEEIGVRGATVWDAEQRLHGSIKGLGSGAVSARWVTLPDTDIPGVTNLGPGPDERFRGDFLRDDLRFRPFARRGVTATWGAPLGALTLDTERHAQADMPTTERWWGVEAVVPDAHLLGPFYLDGSGWAEHLRKTPLDSTGTGHTTEATRTTFDGALGLMQWLGPVGVDASGGVRGINYNNGTIADVRQDLASERHILYGISGLRLRFEKDFGGGLLHAVTPRLGVQMLGMGHGDVLPSYGFGDARDNLEENKRYGVGSVATELTGSGRALFVGTLTTRWALRNRERTYLDPGNGEDVINRHRLVDVSAVVMGTPTASLTLTGQGTYNALLGQWGNLDLASTWKASSWLFARYGTTLLPADPNRGPTWQHRPGLTFLSNRYRYDYDWRLQPGGAAIEEWHLQLTRRMVDGELYIFGDFIRNDDGSIYDKRIGAGFSLTLGGPPEVTPSRNGRGGSFKPRGLR